MLAWPVDPDAAPSAAEALEALALRSSFLAEAGSPTPPRDRQASRSPFREPVLQSRRIATGFGEEPHGVVGVHAVGAATVGDHVGATVDVLQPGTQFADRHGDRTADVSGGVLRGRPHIEDYDIAGTEPFAELVPGHRVESRPVADVRRGQLFKSLDVLLGNPSHRPPQRGHERAREFVEDAGAGATSADQARAKQPLQVLGGVRDGLVDLQCEVLDGSLALGEYVDELGTTTVRQRLRGLGQRVEERRLGCVIRHGPNLSLDIFKHFLDKSLAPGVLFKNSIEKKEVVVMPSTVDVKALETKVKDMYRLVAQEPQGDFHFELGRDLALRLGYDASQLERVPSQAVDSFAGVGHFFDLAGLQPGERVVDLGSGSGMDAFYAAGLVGPAGRVTGIDFTTEQLEKARRLAEQSGTTQVEFRAGRIELLPLPDAETDCVVSNGVINLCPDKLAAFMAAVPTEVRT